MTRQQGFTLLEIMISTGLFAVVMAAIIGVYTLNLHMGVRTGNSARVLDHGQHAIAMLEKDVNEATGVWTPVTHGASASALGLFMPRFDETGLLVASDDTVIYYLREDSLLRDVVPAVGSNRPAVEGQIVLTPATGSPPFSYFSAQGSALLPAHAIADTRVVRVQLQSWGTTASDSVSFRGDYRLRNKR